MISRQGSHSALWAAAWALLACLLASSQCPADPVLEAQLLALDLSGKLTPPPDLTQRLLDDLSAVRVGFPEVADITYRHWAAPDRIIIGLSEGAAEQFVAGQHEVLNELNSLYGLLDYDAFSFTTAFLLHFEQIYHTQRLSELYKAAEPLGLQYAEPDYLVGDGSTISAEPPFYTFIRAWGDCPAGCIHSESWDFRVDDGQATLIEGPGMPGDINYDHVVDSADLGLVRHYYGFSAGGDADLDGRTDASDVSVVRQQFGKTGQPQGAVPEPATMALLGLCMILGRRTKLA